MPGHPGQPDAPGSHAYSGHPRPAGLSVDSRQPGSTIPPAYPESPGPPAHLARGPRRPGRDRARRQWRTDPVALSAIGVLVAIVAVAAILITHDGGGPADPEESATTSTSLVAGDGTDPAGPIVGPTGVIGSWSGSEWEPRPGGEQPGAGLDYTVLGLGDALSTARGEAVSEDCPAQRATSGVDVGVDLDAGAGGGPPPIAVAGVAEPRPRAIELFDTDAAVYRQAAVDVGADLGATTPPTVAQLLRADLDGNGTDEVVGAAEHISDPEGLSPAVGDWSVVFLRRVVRNDVATDVLASSVVGGGGGRLDRIQVATLADLNGDGTMEVALNGRSSTGEWTSIHALDGDGVPSEVLRAGCEG